MIGPPFSPATTCPIPWNSAQINTFGVTHGKRCFRKFWHRTSTLFLMDVAARTLAILEPDDLWAAWKWIDMKQQAGEMHAADATRWKHGIFQMMERWELRPDDLISARLDL